MPFKAWRKRGSFDLRRAFAVARDAFFKTVCEFASARVAGGRRC